MKRKWTVPVSHEAREIVEKFFRCITISPRSELESRKVPGNSPPARWVIGRPLDALELTILAEKTHFYLGFGPFHPLLGPQLFPSPCDIVYIAARESNGPLGHIPSPVAQYGTSGCIRIENCAYRLKNIKFLDSENLTCTISRFWSR